MYAPRGKVSGNVSSYRARYYDPSIGRFISEDLIGCDGAINFYCVQNLPINLLSRA
ncbi:MAG: hypothetical protein LAN64_18430 [Acidobacteriia bacterium]|nr:hypothetical protein [Terriglobia bacterium]